MVLLFVSSFPATAQNKVAIFDYDDRLEQKDTLAKYIEGLITTQIPGTAVKQFSGKADEETSATVMKQIDSSGYKLVVLITSDAVVVAKHYLIKTPALFANANNPLGLGFMSIKTPGGNISGASYYVPVENKIAFFKKIVPGIKKAGFLFDDLDKSRDIELKETRDAAGKLGIEFLTVLVKDKGELKGAVQKLLGQGADSIIISTSSLLYENIGEFYGVCVEKKVPLFSYHTKGVANGAIASLGVDYNVLAEKELMPMLKEVLAGKNPGTLDIRFTPTPDIYINVKSAKDIGMVIPSAIISKAKTVIR